MDPSADASWNTVPFEFGKSSGLCVGPAVFFENHTYEFEFSIKDCVRAEVRHRSRRIKDAFRFDGSTLRGSLNFGNNVGWFSLELVLTLSSNAEKTYSLSFEVLPTKMDVASDFEEIKATIEKTYPLWRFSFARPTSQSLDRKRHHFERIPLLWIEQFKSLRQELSKNVRLVINAPHSRLSETRRSRRVDQLRGKLSRRDVESVTKALVASVENTKLVVATRRLSADTPENQFVLSVLRHCDRELHRFQEKLNAVASHRVPDISDDARREVAQWRSDVQNLLSHSLWNEVGARSARSRDSLVLQGRAGYSGVYRVWLQLRMYLDVLGRHATISLKSIAELYEVWCLLEIRRQLLELGFQPTEDVVASIDYSGIEPRIAANGIGASFQLSRGTEAAGDLINIRLAHEPVFRVRQRTQPGRQVVSWLHAQRPDIVVEATFSNGAILFWVFDAKYRVHRADEHQDEDTEFDFDAPTGIDLAPEDAINQMHRYRDAIIESVSNGNSYPDLSRPVVGAFCMYPGWFPDEYQRTHSSPYKDAIEAVLIGAFPALPGQHNPWLADFLKSQLGTPKQNSTPLSSSVNSLAQWAPRIATAGLAVHPLEDLVLLAHVGGHRTEEYLQGFTDGCASWYHFREKSVLRGQIAPSAIRQVGYCAVALPALDGAGSFFKYIYEVRSVNLVHRSEISAAQAGTETHGADDRYWLFELGQAEALEHPLRYEPSKQFRVWLTTRSALRSIRVWSEVSEGAPNPSEGLGHYRE